MAAFGLASLACAIAPTLPFLVGARIAQALAAAVLIPTSLGIALPHFAPEERAKAMGIWTAIAALGGSAGPVVGGLLLLADWRWIFAINVPITIVAVIAGIRALPGSEKISGGRQDLPGALLVLATAACATATIVQSADWGITSARSLGLATVAVALAVVTLRRILRHPNPVIDPELFRYRPFAVASASVFLYYLVFAAFFLTATLFLTTHWHLSMVAAGLALAPAPGICLLTSPLSGRVVALFGSRASALAGGSAMAAGCLWWAVTMTDQPDYLFAFLPGVLLIGVSTSLLQPPMFGAAGRLPAHQTSVGSAVLMMARQLSSALGVAALTLTLTAFAFNTSGFTVAWTAMAGLGAVSGFVALGFREGDRHA